MLGILSKNRSFVITAVAAAALAGVGVVAAWRTADRIRATEQTAWFAGAEAETARLTNHLISNIYKTEVNLRAISERFRASDDTSQAAFGRLIDEARKWDPDVRFVAVAFAERLNRDQRAAFEQAQEQTLQTVGTPRSAAPDRFEHFAVRVVSPPNDLIRPNADLATHPAFLATINAARRLPGTAVLGPSFIGADNRRQFPIAILSNRENASGVIVALMDLAPFINAVKEFQSSPGLDLRVIEYDSEAGTSTARAAVIGGMAPPEGVQTRVIRLTRGLARWALHWDISKTFRGGPDKDIEMVIRYGGAFLSVVLSAILAFLVIQSLRFHREVRERTAELSRFAMIIQLTMDTIDQGFAVWNSDHRLVVWSKRCNDFWYEPGEWLAPGLHMRDLLIHLAEKGAFGEVAPQEAADRELKRIIGAGTSSDERFEMIDGRHVHIRRFPLEHGGHVAVYTDTSRQEKAMEDLARARDEMEEMVRLRTKDLIVARDKAEQANLAKTRLLANVSHELRTPLNAIIGFSDMIRAGIGNPKAASSTEEYADYIKRAGEHLLSIVSDLLEITRVEAGVAELDIKEIDVRSIVDNVFVLIEKAAQTRGPKLVADIPDGFPTLNADPLRFRQIILNLVDNASKFSPVDSEITVSGEINGRGGMIIRIIDHGIGIQKEDLPRILEPFAQVQDVMSRAHTGIGLGLPLAKSLTEIMDGQLIIDSTPGKGTTVTLSFPASRVGEAYK